MHFKRVLSLLLSAVLALGFCGCAERREDDSFNVVASFTPVYALTLAVTDGAEGITVSSMAETGGGCIHDYQLTTADMRAVEAADVFIINGNGMEKSVLSDITALYPDLAVIDSGKNVSRLIDEEDGYNPHTWLNVDNAAAQVKAIADALAGYDPKNSEIYRKNAENFSERAHALLDEYLPLFEKLPVRDIVIFHESFAYTADELGLTVGTVIAESEDGALSPKEMSEVTARIKASGIKAIFCEPQFPSSAAESIAAETGAVLYELDSLVTGTPSPDSYISTMRENFSVLYSALSE